MNDKPTSILVATGNEGKIRELRQLLGSLPVALEGLKDFPGLEEVEETGTTFRENAELKASSYARMAGRWALADDSGLEVEALGNAPGVYSARFAGHGTGYGEKIAKLLEMLDETGDRERRARFVCSMAFATDAGEIIHTVEGVCEGTITDRPRGANGFGYDPIFVPDGFDQTFGELDDKVKHEISHRAQAARLTIRYLLHFIAGLT